MNCSNTFQTKGPPAKGGPLLSSFFGLTVTAEAVSAAVAEALAAAAGPLPWG